MSFYSDFKKEQEKQSSKSGKSFYAKFKEEQVKVSPTIKQRLTGAPTQQKDGTYKANTGVLPFLREVGNTFTSGTQGTGKILGESRAVNSGAFDSLNKANLQAEDVKLNLVKKYNENKRLGKNNTRIASAYNQLNNRPTDTIQSLAPESQSSNLKAFGNLGMMATELTGLSSVARTGKAFGYLGKEAEKQALKNLTAQELKKRLATEVAFNTSQGYVADVSMRAQNNEKNFKPGLGTALGFGLTGLLGNQQMNRTLNEQSAARIAEKKAQTFPIPEAGTPPPPKLLEAPSIKLPAKGILESQAKLREVPVVETPQAPKSPLQERAFNTNSRQDFINSEIANQTKAKEINTAVSMFQKGRKVITEIPKNTPKQLGKIWDEAHASPKQPATPTIPRQVIDQPTTQPLNSQESVLQGKAQMETPSVKTTPDTPNITTKTPDFEAKVNSDTNWLSKVENKTSENDVRGFKQSSERYAQRLNEDRESLIDYAMGLGDEDPKLPRTSARKLLARDADIENNPDLSEKLSFSTVRRESGQELVGNKIFEEQTTADLLEITRRKRADKLGISENQLRAEEARLFKEIAEDMSKKVSYTTDDLLDIVKDFLC